ncbi:anti-sigma factor family protein [Actinokineospora diospyrosa]|uniref:Zinc-finger n=1 Tax=Actinokineospora diospyrosa TaxID=103728 RepID=A0ABT1I592_9PSEU|nr:zf-HC2 domain-containing protein [Actinokineospora diospyrosa]MCP2267601.1 putative zinc-finger [Actinokineospora diospyrosa]
MSAHETPLLGAYALGVLDDDERGEVERHLTGCADCRAELHALEEVRDMAGELPPEALLDGPPDDGDLLLARTLRQVRSESNASRNRSIAIASVAAAVVIAAVLGTGIVIGRSTGTPQAQTTVTVSPTEPQIEGTRFLSGSDPNTGTRLTAKVVPAAGWVRLNIAVTGIPAGERCRVIVVGKDGSREEAGSWLVSTRGAQEGTTLDGAALVAPGDVEAIEIVNTDGKRFVSVSA